MKQPKHFEKVASASGLSYLFVKRLNPKHGTFPSFKERFKVKLAATTDVEASIESGRIAAELEHLQLVNRKDSRKLLLAIKDMNRAAKTWVEYFGKLNLDEVKQLNGKRTKEAVDFGNALSHVIGEVIDFYREDRQSMGMDGLTHTTWLTPLGDHLVSFLREGETAETLTDAIPLYLKQTGRDHLPETAKAVKDTKRTVDLFVSIAGDRPINLITRTDVERYIQRRLEQVKTTSVSRELGTLRAVWHKAALVWSINQKSPFSEQPISALGTDAVERKTPSLEETRALLNALEARHQRNPASYVTSLLAIAALTGMRLGEAWGLQLKDWDTDSALFGCSILTIRANEKRGTLKNANSARPFPVLPELAVWLYRYFDCSHAKNANSASAATLSAVKLLGFDFGNHSLRHGFRERLKEANAPIDVVEELQGWSSQRMSAYYGTRDSSVTKIKFIRAVYRELIPEERGGNVLSLRRT
jgi:integrase